MKVTFQIGVDTKVFENSTIKFENSSCQAVKQGSNFVITTNFNDCNTKIGETVDDIVFSNRVIVDPNTGNNIIQRLDDVEHVYPVACLLKKENIVVSGKYNLSGNICFVDSN